jgi:hypothetical protein
MIALPASASSDTAERAKREEPFCLLAVGSALTALLVIGLPLRRP